VGAIGGARLEEGDFGQVPDVAVGPLEGRGAVTGNGAGKGVGVRPGVHVEVAALLGAHEVRGGGYVVLPSAELVLRSLLGILNGHRPTMSAYSPLRLCIATDLQFDP